MDRPVEERIELPQVAPGADLPRTDIHKGWVALCFSITFLIYLAFIPRFVLYSSPPTGDQAFYLMDVASLAQDGDLNVKNNYDNQDFDKFYGLAPHPPDFVGMTTIQAPYPLERQLAEAPMRPTSEEYGAHPPGLPLLLAPAWLVGSWFQLWWPATLVVTCLLGALLCVNVFLLAHEMTGRLWIAWAVWLPVAFSNPVMSFAYMSFTELPTGLTLAYAFRCLALGWRANGTWRLLLVGLCIAYIPWFSYRCVPITAVLVAYASLQWLRYVDPEGRLWNRLRAAIPWARGRARLTANQVEEAERSGAGESIARRIRLFISSHGREVRSLVLVLVPTVLAMAILLGFSYWKTGLLLPSATVYEQGLVERFFWPWSPQTGFDDFPKFITAAFGILLDQRFGLLPYTPVYLLVIVGVIAMFRAGRSTDRRLLLWMALLTLPYMVLVLSYAAWHGVWSPPARYLATFAPLAAAPLAMSLYLLSRSRVASIIYGLIYSVLSLVGMLLMYFMMLDARLMWPLPEWTVHTWLANDPAVPGGFIVNVRPFLADFVQPDSVLHPAKSAQLIAAVLLVVAVCYLLLVLQPRPRVPRGLPFAKQGVFGLVTLSLVSLGWYAMNQEHLGPRVTYTQVQRWEGAINPPLREPYGITYLDGAVFVTSFYREGIGTMGKLNVETGGYGPVELVSGDRGIPFHHPSDVKVGPDGMLYVLNNGPGDQALYVIEPEGGIVNRRALPMKTHIATGLYVGGDGSFYVADMRGGRVLKYTKESSEPVGTWLGVDNGFSNPSGVVVGDEGTVYVAESSYQRIQALAPDGRFLRKYDLGCKPVHMVMDGEWLDATCDKGLVAVNTRTGSVRMGIFPIAGSKPQAPTGLAYGPDKKRLYVLDGTDPTVLIEYEVQR